MNVLIDPAIFLPFSKKKIPDVNAKSLLADRLGNLILVLTRLPNARVVFSNLHWNDLYANHIDIAFSECEGPNVRRAITALRRRFHPVDPPKGRITTWGFLSLLASAGERCDYWSNALAQTAVPLLAAGEKVILFTGLDEHRNLRLHQVDHVELCEKTRWAVYVGAIGLPGATLVPCVCNIRNIAVPWTTRYDDRLPDSCPPSGLSFVPMKNWNRKDTKVIRTIAGRPAWLDNSTNGWIRPNTPGMPHHWDVHFPNNLNSPNGLNPCNIVASGVPAHQGLPGGIHHVPAVKASRVRS